MKVLASTRTFDLLGWLVLDVVDGLLKILELMSRFKPEISTLYAMKAPETGENDLIAHLSVADPVGLIDALRASGFEVRMRAR